MFLHKKIFCDFIIILFFLFQRFEKLTEPEPSHCNEIMSIYSIVFFQSKLNFLKWQVFIKFIKIFQVLPSVQYKLQIWYQHKWKLYFCKILISTFLHLIQSILFSLIVHSKNKLISCFSKTQRLVSIRNIFFSIT